MAKYYYNDVLLPEIPADVLAQYPYCWIRLQTDGSKYLFAGKGVWYYLIDGVNQPMRASIIPFNIYTCTDDADTWEFLKSNSGTWGLANGLIWASHDILNGGATATEIYFEGSEPVPEGGAHTHSYTETVTQAATCTTAGVKTYTCECGDSYTEEIPATGHNYVNGVCSVCGAADPDYNGGENTDPDDGGGTGSGETIQPEIDGVTMPPIPADILASFPYVIICYAEVSSVRGYYLTAAKSEFYFLPASLGAGSDILGTAGAADIYQVADESWVLSSEVAAGECYITVGESDTQTVEVCWANHDIYTVTSVDSSTGEFGIGRVYFPDSDPETGDSTVTDYRIQRSTLEDIADQVRRLYYSTTRLTPAQIESKLSYLNLELQEAYVSPSTEEQTIYPSRGYYGFSKIIVEAVEDSGSSGGGGTGEDGDDSGDTGTEDNYVSSDYVAFGAEITELPTPPDDNPYYIIYTYANGGTYMATSVGKFSCYYGGNHPHSDLFVGNDDDTRYSLGDGWGGGIPNSWGICVSCDWAGTDNQSDYYGTVLFTNHDIMNGDEVWMEGMEAESDSVALTIETPVERDETYTIEGNKLNDLILLAQKITGTNEPMTPDEAIEALDKYANPETTE